MLSMLDGPVLSQRPLLRAKIRCPTLIFALRDCQFGLEPRLCRLREGTGSFAGISLKCSFISLAHYHDKEKNGGLLNHSLIYKNATKEPAHLPAYILIMKRHMVGRKRCRNVDQGVSILYDFNNAWQPA
jgi:hypothetical protein